MDKQLLRSALFLTGVFTAGCGGTPGAGPHDMSVSGHERAAELADAAAGQHASQYDASAEGSKARCSNPQKDIGAQPCWTEETNPTKTHLAEAEQMRKAAADHRAASQALRDAEASACAGLSESDRDTSPLVRGGDILRVDEIRAPGDAIRSIGPAKVTGASVTIRAVPGLTKEYLQRLVSCHVARNSSMGHTMPEMTACPLAVKGATATVESAGGAFRVDVRGEDDAAVAEILKRARAQKPAAAP